MSQLGTFSEATKKMSSHNGHDSRVTSLPYWWTWAIDPTTGGLIILGWSHSEGEAYQEGQSNLTSRGLEFEVTPLRTRNRLYAKDLLNKIRLDRGDKIESLMKRAKYKL